MLVTALLLFLLCSCRPKQANTSFLENRDDLAALATRASIDGLTASFVLWCTDTLQGTDARDTPRATLPSTELNVLREVLREPPRPVSARITATQDDGAVVSFSQTTSSGDPYYFWMVLTFRERTIADVSLVKAAEQYDIDELIGIAADKMKDVLSSGMVEGAGLKAVRRLNPEEFRDIAGVRTELSEAFSLRASELIIKTLGMYEREGLVWMPLHESETRHLWQQATIERVVPNPNGLVVNVQVPLRDSGVSDTLDIPFVLTVDGWRLGGMLVP